MDFEDVTPYTLEEVKNIYEDCMYLNSQKLLVTFMCPQSTEVLEYIRDVHLVDEKNTSFWHLIVTHQNEHFDLFYKSFEGDNKDVWQLQNNDGVTPLAFAALGGNLEAIELLVEFVDPNTEDKYGLRAIECSVLDGVNYSSPEIFELLRVRTDNINFEKILATVIEKISTSKISNIVRFTSYLLSRYDYPQEFISTDIIPHLLIEANDHRYTHETQYTMIICLFLSHGYAFPPDILLRIDEVPNKEILELMLRSTTVDFTVQEECGCNILGKLYESIGSDTLVLDKIFGRGITCRNTICSDGHVPDIAEVVIKGVYCPGILRKMVELGHADPNIRVPTSTDGESPDSDCNILKVAYLKFNKTFVDEIVKNTPNFKYNKEEWVTDANELIHTLENKESCNDDGSECYCQKQLKMFADALIKTCPNPEDLAEILEKLK